MSDTSSTPRPRRIRSAFGLALTLGGIASLLWSGPAAAGSRVAAGERPQPPRQLVHSPSGHFLGAIPSTLHTQVLRTTPNGSPPLLYHGGPVVHASRAYAIFWVPSGYYYPVGAKGEVAQYFTDVATDSWKTSNVYGALTQYCQGIATGASSCPAASSSFISNNVSYGGSATVTTAYPASGCPKYTLGSGLSSKVCLTDAQVKNEINSVVSAKGWPRGLGSEFFLFTPPTVGQCQDAAGNSCFDPDFPPPNYPGYCGYHSWITSPQTLYAVQPWADITGCLYSYQVPDSPYPNDDGGDPLVNLISQEHNETMSDPLGTGWYDTNPYTGTFENGSECAFLSLATHYNGIGDYSQTINGDQYLMQAEWSNRAKNCVETNTYPQPTGTFTATAGSTAHSENFAASVTDTDDTSFVYSWTFGDGTTSTLAKPSHTYAAAGAKTVTLTVFDAHGDQLHVVKAVTIS